MTEPAAASDSFEPTARTTVRRLAKRGLYDRQAVYAILDEALLCHVGFAVEGSPMVIPTIHARIGDRVYVHGSAASHMLRSLKGGVEACVTVTLIDGLVLARSAFHHSMNYRSVMIFGTAREVSDPEEKVRVLDALVEHVVPGRAREVRPPDDKELRQTLVLSLSLDEVSAKVRTGGPVDDDEDYALPVWAGVVPLKLMPSAPIPDERMTAPIAAPAYALNYRRGSSE